jgi:hypothetical protein
MSPNQTLFAISTAIFLIAAAIIYFIERIEKHGAIHVPVHVPIADANAYTAQEVYDWAVYVTRVTGNDYLEQLNWSSGSRHSFLLSALRTVLFVPTIVTRNERFKEIGRSFQLDTSIVDKPI